jgi:hypothetical protein
VNPLIWLPFLETCSSSDTSYCFSLPHTLLAHCARLEKLLHFDCREPISTKELESHLMPFYLSLSRWVDAWLSYRHFGLFASILVGTD